MIDGVWIVGFIELLTRDYTSQITITHQSAFSVTVFTSLLGSNFHQQMFPIPLGFRTVPGLSYQHQLQLSTDCLPADPLS
jgi:hypothetical protein